MRFSSAFSFLALALSAGSALAADLPSFKAPPPPPPPVAAPMWTGFYAGLNAGYGFGTGTSAPTTVGLYDQYFHSYFSQPGWPPLLAASSAGLAMANSGAVNLDQNGFVGGGQIGYNYQWGPNFVVGLEVDMQGAAVRGSGSYAGMGQDLYSMGRMMLMPHGTRISAGGGSVNAGLDWFGTVRGRLGYLVTPTTLIYATGGLTYGGAFANAAYGSSSLWCDSASGCYGGMLTFPYTQTAFGAGHASNTLVGWNAGGGVEWMFMPNVSLKAEAFYYDLGSMNLTGVATAPISGAPAHMGRAVADAQLIYPTTRIRYDGVVARAGVNYHFNWGSAPVVASY